MERRLRVHPKLRALLVRALNESMSPDLMERLTRRLIPDYDLYERTGYQRIIPIPALEMANQIARDFGGGNLLLRLVEALIEIDGSGFMGTAVPIRGLKPLVQEVEALGYAWDGRLGLFMETDEQTRTRNWSYLQEGQSYELSFLRVDVVGSTTLVRRHPRPLVDRVCRDLQRIVVAAVYRRGGRIWKWEGDGGVAAFLFGDKNVQSSLAGMEILLELFLVNTFHRPLESPMAVRMAVHTGPCPYHDSFQRIQSDTLRRLELIESNHTQPDSLTISPGVYSDLGTKLGRFFAPFNGEGGGKLYRYQLAWEGG